ncbi:NB-ARC domain containing protein [Fagus crenata]
MAHEGQPRNVHLALSALDKDQSWEKLVSMVFEHNNCPLALEDFGGFEDSLVKKCHGFPLAILLLGSLLSKKEKKSSCDSKVSTRQLFQLWIAEGFIHENFEATAEVYLDELIDRGFIQVLKRRSDARMKTCKIHDLVLEFIARKPAEMDLFRIRNCIIKDSNVDALQFMLTCLRSFP